jgi:hypothetical protein
LRRQLSNYLQSCQAARLWSTTMWDRLSSVCVAVGDKTWMMQYRQIWS